MKKLYLLLALVLCFGVKGQDTSSTFQRQAAQNYMSVKPGKSKFMMRGYYHSGLEKEKNGSESTSNFTPGSIAPILMYKQSDKLFFEAEFEGEFGSDGKFEWGMEYADMSYMLNKYATVRAGKFILPFGTFMEKLHPAWINRLSTKPLGIGHDGIIPTSDVGVEVRGASYFGSLKLNYQAYVVNGPQLKDGAEEEDEAGMLNFGDRPDNNNDKTIGGRLGIMPFSNSMMEIGFSGLTGKVGSDGSSYENVRANLYAIDFSFVKNIDMISSVVDIKAQYNYAKIGNASFVDTEDSTEAFYTFNNSSNTYYTQLSIRPSLLNNNFLRKLEFVVRYSELETPEGALWEQSPTQLAIGVNYWIDWRTAIKLGYQTTDGLGGGHDAVTEATQDVYYIHWAMGF